MYAARLRMGRGRRHRTLPRHDDRCVKYKEPSGFAELALDVLDGNPNHSQACGKTATATYNGKSITLGIVDRCYACGYDDIDLAPAAFEQFANRGESKR